MRKILEAPIIEDPFPNLYVEDVFPSDLFAEMLRNLPSPGQNKNATPLQGQGHFWQKVNRLFDFNVEIAKKLGVRADRYQVRLVTDPAGYQLGPHTDSPKKVFAFVFYLKGESGTSLYVPKAEGFEHDGTAHLKFEDFTKVKELPFKPNSVGGFARTNQSFHGVEKTTVPRWTLLYNGFID